MTVTRDDDGARTSGSAAARTRREPGADLPVRRHLRRLLGLSRAATRRGTAAADDRRHPLPAPRLPGGALRESRARPVVRAGLLSQRDHLGLRLRRAIEPTLAVEARHDPGLRERPRPRTTSTPPRSTGSRTWHRVSSPPRRSSAANFRRMSGGTRSSPPTAANAPGTPRRSRRASCAASCTRRALPVTRCSTCSPAQVRRGRSRRHWAAATCWSIRAPKPSR